MKKRWLTEKPIVSSLPDTFWAITAAPTAWRQNFAVGYDKAAEKRSTSFHILAMGIAIDTASRPNMHSSALPENPNILLHFKNGGERVFFEDELHQAPEIVLTGDLMRTHSGWLSYVKGDDLPYLHAMVLTPTQLMSELRQRMRQGHKMPDEICLYVSGKGLTFSKDRNIWNGDHLYISHLEVSFPDSKN